MLTFIEERLAELEQEKEELTEYDQLDKLRRALEYTIYDNELEKATAKLAEVETAREAERGRQVTLRDAYSELQEARLEREEDLSVRRSHLARLTARLAELTAETKSLQAARAKVLAALEEARLAAAAGEEECGGLAQALDAVRQQIAAAEARLQEGSPEYARKQQQSRVLQAELEQVRARTEALYGRQGRGRQFATRAERDAFLRDQVRSLEVQLRDSAALLEEMDAEVGRAARRHELEATGLQTDSAVLAKKKARLTELAREIADGTVARNDLQDQRKRCWRELELLQEQSADAKTELEKGRQQLAAALPRSIALGLSEVERIASERQLTGYYGPVIDNFSLKNAAFQTAVEVAAGNSLFHVIVDTDATAAELMRALESRGAGRLTFLPLNQLRVPAQTYPDSRDVRSLLEVAIAYEPKFEQAMRQVRHF